MKRVRKKILKRLTRRVPAPHRRPLDWRFLPDSPLCGGTAHRVGNGRPAPWRAVVSTREAIELVPSGQLQEKANALPEGAALVLRAGSEHRGEFRLKHRQAIVAEGDGAKLSSPKQRHWLDCRGLTGVRLHNLDIDVFGKENFATSLSAIGARGLSITSCRFRNTEPDVAGYTIHGVLAQDIQGLWVEDCLFEGCQLKTGGSGAGLIRVRDCRFVRPHNFGVSVMASQMNDEIRDVVIERCEFENPTSRGAIYIGDDHSQGHRPNDGGLRPMHMEDVTIRDIVVHGEPDPNGTNNSMIKVFPTSTTRNVLLEDIRIETESLHSIYIASRRVPPEDNKGIVLRNIHAVGLVRLVAPMEVELDSIDARLWLRAVEQFGQMHARVRSCPQLYIEPVGGVIEVEEF